ncbi:MAG: PASTA domain-containing protein [candidate division WOR-3 bacterium]
MKKKLIYILISIGSFFFGFGSFYFLMPLIVRQSKPVEVPYLYNMSIERAKNLLSTMNLRCVILDSVNSTEVPRGYVVRTEPPPKEDVRMGGVIKLIISKGPKKVRLPNIIGLSRKEAIDSLNNNGLTNYIFVNYPISNRDLNNKVVKTKPAIQDSIEEGGMLTIFIGSTKKKVFLMPNIIGMNLQEAQEELSRRGLILEEIKRTTGSDIVIQQSPLPGVEVTSGDRVRIVVGK